MTRSVWKNEITCCFINKNKLLTKLKFRNFKISSIIVNSKVAVYNGNKFISFYIKDFIVGFILGEFLSTRKVCLHKNK